MRGMSLFVGDDGAVTGARVARLEVMEVIYWGTGERSETRGDMGTVILAGDG